ncbi:MAG: hypothetical protein M0C28_26840 [Candidatus Moduliflexus flocculans]|nr:hypothetical protein [Candidatus Moduliflexus flocculans]
MPRIYFEAFLVKLCHFRKIVPIRELIREMEAFRQDGQARGRPSRPAGPSSAAGHPAGVPPTRSLRRRAPPGSSGPGGSPSPGAGAGRLAKPAAPAQKDVFVRVLERAGRATGRLWRPCSASTPPSWSRTTCSRSCSGAAGASSSPASRTRTSAPSSGRPPRSSAARPRSASPKRARRPAGPSGRAGSSSRP